MTRKIPLTLALAALVGFAAPAFAAGTHAAAHDPQVAASTTKSHKKASSASTKHHAAKGRHAKASKASKARTATHAEAQPASTPAR